MYIHLTAHSAFSLQEGLSTPTDLVQAAQGNAMPALGPADHNLLTGVVAFVRACEAAEIQPIIGLEVNLRKESVMLNILIRWLIFAHVLSALTFFLAHGTSAAMAFRVRGETDFTRIRAMLDLSESTIELMFGSFLVMGLTGVALPFLLRLWNKGWVWASIMLMAFVFIWMVSMNERAYKTLRKLVGLPYRQGAKEYPPQPAANPEEVVAQLKKINLTGLISVGYVIPAFVLWLMIFKPF